MIKTLLKQVKQYKRESLLTPLFTALEVLLEVLIPFITASIIDKGIEQRPGVFLRRADAHYGIFKPSVRCSGGEICGSGLVGICL